MGACPVEYPFPKTAACLYIIFCCTILFLQCWLFLLVRIHFIFYIIYINLFFIFRLNGIPVRIRAFPCLSLLSLFLNCNKLLVKEIRVSPVSFPLFCCRIFLLLIFHLRCWYCIILNKSLLVKTWVMLFILWYCDIYRKICLIKT